MGYELWRRNRLIPIRCAGSCICKSFRRLACRDGHSDRPGREPRTYLPASTDTSTASVQVISTLSPTFTLPSASLSSTLDEYFHPFGPVKVTDGIVMSMAVIVAVTLTCLALVPPGRVRTEGVVVFEALYPSGSPGCLSRRMTFS